MGQILGAICKCGYQCDDLMEGDGFSGIGSTIYTCSNCGILYSGAFPKLPKRPSFGSSEYKIWDEERKKIIQSDFKCQGCGEMAARIAPLESHEIKNSPGQRFISKLKNKIRNLILDTWNLPPKSVLLWPIHRKIRKYLYWKTLFLSKPVYLCMCPKCNKSKLRFYQIGHWD